MSFVSSSDHPSTDDVTFPSPSLAPQHIEWDYLTLPEDSFGAFPGEEGFDADFFPPPANLRNVMPFVHSQEPQQPTGFMPFQQSVIHPALAPQSPFDGTYSLRGQPSASGPGSSFYGGGGQAIFGGGGQNMMAVPVPSTSGTVPMSMTSPAAAPIFSSLHGTVPMSGSPVGASTPVVRAWDPATATPAGASVPRHVSTFCRCRLRAHPFVHVGDKIEWVRPDLMRMDIWFNWSLNAEAEAHGWSGPHSG
jgi:hypothetical protein